MMAMVSLHPSSLLAIIVATLFSIAAVTAQNTPPIYNICAGSGPTVVTVNENSAPFIILSPNYGNGYYDNDIDCSFIVQSEQGPLVLSFEYRVFDLQGSQDCISDSLCVVGVKFCGKWAQGRMFQQFLPGNSNSTVRFLTDSYVTRSGFHIIVTSQPTGGQTLHQVEGSGWDQNAITYVPATYYTGMPYRDGCRPAPPITTTENTPTPTRVNDVYYFCNNGQSNIIDIRANNFPLLIRSPNYPLAPYCDNQLCSVVLRSGAYPLVVNLNFRDFQVEPNDECSYDYLCVGGVKFCGEWVTGYNFQYILPENSNFTLIFKTDSSVVQRGFEIAVSHWSAINQVIYQPALDVGSSNASLSYTIERYQPGYPYTDKCVPPNTPTPVYTTCTSVTDGPYRTTSSSSTDGPLCYPADYVREVTAAIDRAIDDLYRAKELLRQNN